MAKKNEADAEQTAAQTAQMDKMLDALAEQQAEIATLKAAQTGVAAAKVNKNDKTAEFDAELKGLLEQFKDAPNIQTFERRVLVGIDANTEIRLKGEPAVDADPRGEKRIWKLRWFNLAKDGRSEQATAGGWMKVAWTELPDQESIATGIKTDQWVRKGERGQEVLYKLQLPLFLYNRRREAARRQGLLNSESSLRNMTANAVAGMASRTGGNADQAGSFIDRGMSFEITPGVTERVSF